jgi:hypothetical protein
MHPLQDQASRPPPPIWLRLAFIFLGIFILLWLPVEEHSLALLLLISLLICSLGWLAFLDWQRRRQPSSKGKKVLLAGMLAGAAVTLVVLALMGIKTGIHGHGAPDYSPAQVSLALRLTPLWICLGLLAGGLAAVRRR